MTQPSDTTQQEVSGGAVRITAAAPLEQVRIILFYVDDVAYTVPKIIPANWGLQFLEIAALHSSGVAQVWLMEQMIGDEAMAVLKDADGMTAEQWKQLRDAFDDLYAPQVEELLTPKGSKRLLRNSRGSRT